MDMISGEGGQLCKPLVVHNFSEPVNAVLIGLSQVKPFSVVDKNDFGHVDPRFDVS